MIALRSTIFACLLAAPAAPALASTPLTGATAVSAGDRHACAVVNGGVKCWGANWVGQLGDGTETDRAIAADVSSLPAGSGVTAVAAGYEHTCAVANGGVLCWGRNAEGQLGTGSPSLHSTTPVAVLTLGAGSGVTSIAAGQWFTCAVVNGGVLCWGANVENVGTPSASPQVVIAFNSGATVVSAGYAHACAVVNSGVWCWGSGGWGQLGNGTYGSSAAPVTAIPSGSGATTVSAGYGHSCTIAAGTLLCWGTNLTGELGNGEAGPDLFSPIPVAVSGGINTAAGVSAGAGHSCAIANGGVLCWGFNLFGPLGNGSWQHSTVPDQVVGLAAGSGATAVHAGMYFTCAVVNGGVQCWGYGEFGELGNGAFALSSVPVTVVVDSVTNTAPDVGPVDIWPGAVIASGSVITATAGFADPDSGDTHTCDISWGDGTTDAPLPSMSSCTGSHTYTSPGVYVVTVAATDAAGASNSSTFSYVVVYDPAGGFVTGGGWFDSTAGAYHSDPSLTGRAQFGFVARYGKGAHVPEGHTEFQFTTAGLTFRSIEYEWLVVSGAKATYKGVGRINGTGEFGFMLSVVDGDLRGDGGDRLRLRVWDRATGATIYDNQTCGGTSAEADACTEIRGGGVVIHSAKK